LMQWVGTCFFFLFYYGGNSCSDVWSHGAFALKFSAFSIFCAFLC